MNSLERGVSCALALHVGRMLRAAGRFRPMPEKCYFGTCLYGARPIAILWLDGRHRFDVCAGCAWVMMRMLDTECDRITSHVGLPWHLRLRLDAIKAGLPATHPAVAMQPEVIRAVIRARDVDTYTGVAEYGNGVQLSERAFVRLTQALVDTGKSLRF